MKKTGLFLFLVFISVFAQAASTEMAVTVDDLPAHGQLPPGVTRMDVVRDFLKVLKKHRVPEVYGFINAAKVEFKKEDAAVLKAWRQAGYPLGNHTYSHMDLHKAAVKDFEEDIVRNEALLAELGGETDWRYFRYPYLREGDVVEKRNAVRAFLKEKKYRIAQVSVDFEDWSWNEPYARCMGLKKKPAKALEKLRATYLAYADQTLDRAVKVSDYLYKRPVKHVLLLHIGAFDALMLDRLLSLYEKKGVTFIPLSVALNDDIYKADPGIVGKWGSEFPYQVLKSKGLKLQDIGAGTEVFPSTVYPEEMLGKVCR